MRVVHVSTITQTYDLVPNALGGDTLTFLATGDVIAGIDLSQLKQEDIRRDLDGTIVVRLPASQVLVTRLDTVSRMIINRKTGFFPPRRPEHGRARASTPKPASATRP